MKLTEAEFAVIEALSLYVVGGRLDPYVSIGEIISQTGIDPDIVNAAISRLMGRNWIAPGLPYPWTDDEVLRLQGEGLSRAAALAARRELSLYEIKVGPHSYYISYEDPARNNGRRTWIARAHRAEAMSNGPAAEAPGITRAKARDALVQRLSEAAPQRCGQA